MNIFFLSRYPNEAAIALCDKHIPKMFLETCQMLSTAVQRHRGLIKGLYKPAYSNHPMTKWVGDTRANFEWAMNHAMHIEKEYEIRFKKTHKSSRILTQVIENFYFYDIPKGDKFISPPQCMPDEYKHKNYVTAYRRYYAGDKDRFAKWEKGRSKPKWYEKTKNTIKALKEKIGQESIKKSTNKKRDSYSYQMGTSA